MMGAASEIIEQLRLCIKKCL